MSKPMLLRVWICSTLWWGWLAMAWVVLGLGEGGGAWFAVGMGGGGDCMNKEGLSHKCPLKHVEASQTKERGMRF